MYGKVFSAIPHGIDGKCIEVEIDLSNGLPQMNIVGLPDSAVREAIERVRAAIRNCGYRFPMERITVNLAPAQLRKEGTAFDLAIAAGILLTSEQWQWPVQNDKHDLVPSTQSNAVPNARNSLWIGELALDGSLRAITGILPMLEQAAKCGLHHIFLPVDHVAEASYIQGLQLYPLRNLSDAANVLQLIQAPIQVSVGDIHRDFKTIPKMDDWQEVRGQQQAKRALMVAAAGMHSVLLVGPPGTGKTMLARRLHTLLPPLNEQELLEVTKIYSVAGKLDERANNLSARPFRAPHHSISAGGLIGGGSYPKPGEITLAHHGVLMLDEFGEYARPVLELLRQPLEDRSITINRARTSVRFPAKFLLIATMNPCPCGRLGLNINQTNGKECRCTDQQIQRYRQRISGPLLDRIDIQVEMSAVDFQSLRAKELSPQQSQSFISAKVQACHQIQQAVNHRQRSATGTEETGLFDYCNSALKGAIFEERCALSGTSEHLLTSAHATLGFSARAHDRLLRVARTIADLEQSERIEPVHLAEAIQMRALDHTLAFH